MFEFIPKKNTKILEDIMDDLVGGKTVVHKNGTLARQLGRYAKPLREKDRKILHLSYDYGNDESIAYLKINNGIRPNIVNKHWNSKKGKPAWVFRDTLLPKLPKKPFP